MGDPLLNCMTGVCCPPADQANAIAGELVRSGVCDNATEAIKYTKWLLKTFDLAPHGALRPLVASIARLARA